MNSQALILTIAVIILLGLGGYFLVGSFGSNEDSVNDQNDATTLNQNANTNAVGAPANENVNQAVDANANAAGNEDTNATPEPAGEPQPINPPPLEQIISAAPTLTLEDVSGGTASGTARLGLYDGRTYHSVRAANLPALTGGDFYEGWLVIPGTANFFSTGKMTYDSASGSATLSYTATGDVTDHRLVVITLEPDDGDPAPAAHIIEAAFSATTNFSITP